MADINDKIEKFDSGIIHKMRHIALPFGRFAIFVVYFWFGILKIFSLSPANPLVADLLARTMPFISFGNFIIAFGVFEMMIGLFFIIPRLERIAIFVMFLHLIMTIMPLFLLPTVAWQSFMVPTLEGQYIIKNILLIAMAMTILAHLHPFHHKKNV